MGATPNYSLPYPELNDPPDGQGAFQSLAEAVDTTLSTLDVDAIPETIVNAKGDIIVGTAADTVTRIAVGSNDQILTADSSQISGVKWAAAPSSGISPNTVDAKGDLLVGTADNTVARLAVGSNGQVLTADSSQTAGVKWAPASSGAVYAVCSSNSSTSSTTPTDITGLSWSLVSSATYILDMTVFYTAGTTGDMGVAFSAPSMTTVLMGKVGEATGTAGDVNTVAQTDLTSFFGLAGQGTSNRKMALYRAYFVTSASGTLQARIRQEASDGSNATTALAGSWGSLYRIS